MLMNSSQKYETGLSIIESLISLLIISVGLLGIAALQLTSLQQNSSAHWHSQAVWYSYEMTDRISANNNAFNDYSGIDTDDDFDQDCQAAPCTAAQMATSDAEEWASMLSNLPGGRGIITSPSANMLTVSIMWNDNSGESNCVNGEPDASDKTCYTVTIRQ